MAIQQNPMTNPISGEVNIGRMTLYKSPPQAYQGLPATGADQMTTLQSL